MLESWTTYWDVGQHGNEGESGRSIVYARNAGNFAYGRIRCVTTVTLLHVWEGSLPKHLLSGQRKRERAREREKERRDRQSTSVSVGASDFWGSKQN